MPVVRLSHTKLNEGISPSMSIAFAEHTRVSDTLGEDGVNVTFWMDGLVFSMVVLTVVVSCPPYPSCAVMVHVSTSETEIMIESRRIESPVPMSCPPTDHV